MDKKYTQLTTDFGGLLASQQLGPMGQFPVFTAAESSGSYTNGLSRMKMSDIVIVDDNEADLFFTAMLLKSKGHTNITEFHSGAEMVQAYEKGLPCDILFMDVRMPQMDGFDTVEALAQTKRWSERMPTVYMVSAAANSEDRKRAAEHEAIREMARKPLSAEALASLVKRAK